MRAKGQGTEFLLPFYFIKNHPPIYTTNLFQ